MFLKARIKLTIWYVGVIMIISGLFSGLVFHRVSQDIEQGFKRGINRIKIQQFLEDNQLPIPSPGTLHRQLFEKRLNDPNLFIDDIEDAKHRLLISILITNGALLVISAAGSYYLAGITLKPIQQAYQQQKQFIADASHELKTPITALKTSLEVNLMDESLPAPARTILKENLEDVTNLEKLTHNLLKLASYEVSKHHFCSVNIYTQAQKAIKQLKPLAVQKHQQLHLISKYKTTLITADEQSIFELLLIFLDNAIKYTGDKGIISIKISRLNHHVKITITDTGIGIKPQNIPFIYDRFFQEDSSRSKQTDAGFGLGLSVAKSIIDQHQGIISVRTKPGQGTTFTIKLPR